MAWVPLPQLLNQVIPHKLHSTFARPVEKSTDWKADFRSVPNNHLVTQSLCPSVRLLSISENGHSA